MDLYRSMFFVNTLDHEYNSETISVMSNLVGAVESFDTLARKLYDTSLSEDAVSKIKQDMSRNLNLMMANRYETLAEATRLYETVDSWLYPLILGRSSIQHIGRFHNRI